MRAASHTYLRRVPLAYLALPATAELAARMRAASHTYSRRVPLAYLALPATAELAAQMMPHHTPMPLAYLALPATAELAAQMHAASHTYSCRVRRLLTSPWAATAGLAAQKPASCLLA
eukprot:scaffold49539_cov66-Phaeocystis_antarctica.AAC.2